MEDNKVYVGAKLTVRVRTQGFVGTAETTMAYMETFAMFSTALEAENAAVAMVKEFTNEKRPIQRTLRADLPSR